MKIAILTSGILPVPAVKGGAVETLIDFNLKYNHEHNLHDITVYSVWDSKLKGHPALLSKSNHYHYINVSNLYAKVCKHLYRYTHRKHYYNYTIEYFFHQAWKKIQKEYYDIILLNNRPGYAILMDNIPNDTRLFLYLHNDLLNNKTKACHEVYKKASCIITVSDYIANRVKTINPNDTKCITVYNGIDVKAFSPDIKPIITRFQMGLSNDDFVVVFSGRVIKEKGVCELIDAMIQLKDYQKIKLLIIGSPFLGNANTSDFINELKQKAESIANKIIFTGYVDYIKMPSYIKMADIAVLPSMWEEPFGNTIVEAMAAGIPLITTRSGGIPEICEGVATILENDNNTIVSNLSNAIIDLYNHPKKRQQMSAAALKRSQQFSKENYSRDYFNALKGIK